MAYRRKQGIQRSATFVDDHRQSSGGGGSASPAVASPRATRFADDGRRSERSALEGELPAFGDRVKAAPASAGAPGPLQVHLFLLELLRLRHFGFTDQEKWKTRPCF
jgi:hypothetical protein